ncbi:MAG: hydroxypyruvate isomerase family protein [Proteobacteria bacterium]|nr:hydroxypyruvate isomerase family protein [Pseudomonadota bacterium]
MPRFSANLSFLFTEVPFLERFAEAKQAGFHAVEFAFAYDFAIRDIVDAAAAQQLDVVLINAPPGAWAGGERGLACVDGREHDFAADVVTGLRYASALHCPRMHVMAGIVPADAADEDRARARRLYVRNLRAACEEAQAYGVTIMIEPINPRDMPGYLLNTQADAHAIREAVGASNLKVQMDLYHAQIVEGDLAVKLKRWLPQIGHIQIAGVPDRGEPDVGEVNYTYLFRLLDDLRYAGYVGCEYRPARGTADGLAWMYRLLDRAPR